MRVNYGSDKAIINKKDIHADIKLILSICVIEVSSLEYSLNIDYLSP